MPDSDKTLAQTPSAQALALFENRPPLPPEPADPAWSWTHEKLKAVYLDAFTELSKTQIAEHVGIDKRTIFRWRAHPDYKRYLAQLVYTEGLADRVERIKARKKLASQLETALAAKLSDPIALAREKIAPLLKAQAELLHGLADDVGNFEEHAANAQQQRVAGAGFDLAQKIAQIQDPTERETVKKHLLALFKEYVDKSAQTPVIDGELAGDTEKPGSAQTHVVESSTLDTSSAAGRPDTENPAGAELAGDLLES